MSMIGNEGWFVFIQGEEDKSVYAVNGLEWGILTDVEKRQKKSVMHLYFKYILILLYVLELSLQELHTISSVSMWYAITLMTGLSNTKKTSPTVKLFSFISIKVCIFEWQLIWLPLSLAILLPRNFRADSYTCNHVNT